MPDGAFARSGDPETSKDAARSLDGQVTYLVRDAGVRGRTLDELIDATGLDKVTVSPRLRPLCNKDLVREGAKRPGKSGRGQTVWIAATRGDE
jgi:hypothetical protein